jgi:hypothetical protein
MLCWQVTTEAAVQCVMSNLCTSSRSEIDRLELFETICTNSDLYFNSTQVCGVLDHAA